MKTVLPQSVFQYEEDKNCFTCKYVSGYVRMYVSGYVPCNHPLLSSSKGADDTSDPVSQFVGNQVIKN
jgi:hypothetical protein